MIGAAFDGVGPFALARAEIGRRQQFGQRHHAGQRRAQIMRDAGERRLDARARRAPPPWPRGRASCARRLATALRLLVLRFAIHPRPSADHGTDGWLNRARPFCGYRRRSTPCCAQFAQARGAASISTACGRRRRGSGDGDGRRGCGRPSSVCSRRCTLVAWNRSRPRTTCGHALRGVVDDDGEVIAGRRLLARQDDVAPGGRIGGDARRSRRTAPARFRSRSRSPARASAAAMSSRSA